MEIKTNALTPILVLGLLVVLIANHFYNPLEALLSPYDRLANVPSGVPRIVLSLVCPFIASMNDMVKFIGLAGSDEFSSRYLAVGIIGFLYAVIVFVIERAHSSMHEDESSFTICVNMLCLENISMYIFSIFAYFMYGAISNLTIPVLLYFILLFFVYAADLFVVGTAFLYVCIGLVIIMLPALIVEKLLPNMSPVLADRIMTLIAIFMAQVIWRSCSDKVYKKVIHFTSLGHIDLDD